LAINAALPGISVESIVKYILNVSTDPGVLVINYSAASFYMVNNRVEAIPDLKLQDFVDDKIITFLSSKIYIFDKGKPLLDHFIEFIKKGTITPKIDWISRTKFSDGFFSATLCSNNNSVINLGQYQVKSYQEGIAKKLEQPEELKIRREEIIEIIRKAQRLGWTVVLVRLPIGENMEKVENQLPAEFRPEAIAKELSLRFIDYNHSMIPADIVTVDESHLTPDSARKFAVILAKDLSFLSGSLSQDKTN
jgi:hypothetical protein